MTRPLPVVRASTERLTPAERAVLKAVERWHHVSVSPQFGMTAAIEADAGLRAAFERLKKERKR